MTDDELTVDVVVIGAGPAGEVVAGRCGDGGLQTVIVERELVGGECSYWGCIPSKTLIRPGDVLAAARRVPGAAQAVNGTLDVAAALARRDEMTSHWHDDGQLPWLAEHHVDLVRGVGRLTGPREVEVTAADDSRRRLVARRAVVVATGTRAAIPPIPGLAEAEPWDNRTATQTSTLPRRLVAIGGGAVGCELAQAFARMGVAVTLVEGGPRLLAREEPFASDQVAAGLTADGVRVLLGAATTGVRRAADGEVTVDLADGTRLTADEILVAAGRRPATADLGLDTLDAGMHPGHPIEVDDQQRAVAVPDGWLYAVGDANGRALLTHMGKYQARIAADVILGKNAVDRASRNVIPRVTFTDPQVCAVGRTEAQAREDGVAVRVVEVATASVAGASTEGEDIAGSCRLVIDTDRDVVVGATFTGPAMAELLHSATVAVAGGVPLGTLWHAVPSFPTVSEVWLKLLEEAGL
ncbi:MAG: NAD(P)/FAD-dependent oxidoreductase [Actinomycetota bacterium]|nr:MAG: NAD(P)/FAD-dependent oxidoreductase [Actinomycetota bacterium]